VFCLPIVKLQFTAAVRAMPCVSRNVNPCTEYDRQPKLSL
jgi:hypothetical protein